MPGLHVRDVLDAVAAHHPGLLEKFGGHAMAAGMTLRAERLPDFAQAFAAEVDRCAGEDTLSGDLYTDGPLAAGEFTADTAVALREGGPWGAGFAEPAFDGRFGVIDTRVVGSRHLKLRLRAASGETTQAIAFRYLDDPQAAAILPQQSIDLVYRAALDEYGGGRRLQLVAEWLAPRARIARREDVGPPGRRDKLAGSPVARTPARHGNQPDSPLPRRPRAALRRAQGVSLTTRVAASA